MEASIKNAEERDKKIKEINELINKITKIELTDNIRHINEIKKEVEKKESFSDWWINYWWFNG